MLADRISHRLWPVLCTCATILFFLFLWGPPEWVSLFPQGTLYRFIDALWFDILFLALIVIPCLFCFTDHKYTVYSFSTGLLFLAAFSCSILLKLPLSVTDAIVRVFSWIVIVTLFICATRDVIHARSDGSTTSKTSDPFRIWALLLFPVWVVLSGIELLIPDPGIPVLIGKGVVVISCVFIPVHRNKSGNSVSGIEGLGISARELEVLSLVRKGYTNQEIADTLYVSVVTVKTHLTHLFEKTKARNRVELLNATERKTQNTTFGG